MLGKVSTLSFVPQFSVSLFFFPFFVEHKHSKSSGDVSLPPSLPLTFCMAPPEISTDDEEIEWDPTPVKPPLSRYEQRLKDINEGLAAHTPVSNPPSSRMLDIMRGLQQATKRPASPVHLNPSKRQKPTVVTTVQKVQYKLRSTSDQNHHSNTPAVALTVEQRRILEMVVAGKSLFYTGSAGKQSPTHNITHSHSSLGTGKSILLGEIISTLKEIHPEPLDVAITAPTGQSLFVSFYWSTYIQSTLFQASLLATSQG